jgi:hypothetical protein
LTFNNLLNETINDLKNKTMLLSCPELIIKNLVALHVGNLHNLAKISAISLGCNEPWDSLPEGGFL